MPISDEIIELAPVKKTKSKIIIMFVIMGVLLAAAVAFLVMYLVKPSAVASDGSVGGVKITESTTLFSTTNDKDEPILTASVGSSYTVYATINVKGKSSPEITWKAECGGKVINPTAVFSDFEAKLVGEDDEEAEAGKTRFIYSYTFTPNSAYVNKEITLSAVSQEETSQSDKITFTVVEQTTEHIFFTEYSGSTTGNRQTAITNNTLSLPCYAASANNGEFRVWFTQKGRAGVKKDEYADISVMTNSDGSQTDKVSIITEPANQNVISLNSDYNAQASRFGFRVQSAGEVDIVIVANVNNESPEVRAKLHIVAKSSTDLGIIDSIYFTDKPVTAEFYKANWTNAANGNALVGADGINILQANSSLTLPFDEIGNYNNILKHVVLVPFNLQCTKNGDNYTLKDGWQNNLNIISSNPSVCSIPNPNWNEQGKYYNYILICKNLAAGAQCSITVSDKTTGAVAKPCTIPLNIVAPSADRVALKFKLGDKTYEGDDLEKPIAISQLAEGKLTVSYTFNAPADTDVTTLVDHYISKNFTVSFDKPDFMTLKLNNVAITPGKVSSFDGKSMSVEKQSGQTKYYIGTATFDVTVGDNEKVKNGEYTLTFKKIGLPLTNKDADIEKTIKFNVSEVANKAEFVDNEHGEATAVIVNGTGAGSFVLKEPDGDKQVCDIYIQNQDKDAQLSSFLRISDLIRADQGNIRTTVSVDNVANPGGAFIYADAYEDLKFSGNNPSSSMRQLKLSAESVAVGTSNKVVGKFTINVYVINAIGSITVSADPAPVYYTKDNKSNLNFVLDTVTATTVSPVTTLTSIDKTFRLMYYFGGDYRYFDEQKIDGEPGNILYGITADDEFNPVFKYTASSSRITAYNNADPFLIAYKCKVTLSQIRIEYSTVESDLYEQGKKTCFRTYSIIRQADSIGVFTDSAYKNKLELDGNKYAYSLNQREHGTLFASAIIDNPYNADEPIVVMSYSENMISKAEMAYFVVPSDVGLDSFLGSDYSEVSNACTSFSFDAPVVTVNGNDNTKVYDTIRLYRSYANNQYTTIEITVHNSARPIKSFGLFADENCENKLETLEFGKYAQDAASPYTLTFYVEIVYDNAIPGTYVYFETADIKLPQYLKIKFDDGDWEDASEKYTIGQSVIKNDDESNIDQDNITLRKKCTVQLISENAQYRDGRADADKIEFKCATLSDAPSACAKVGTGIDTVSYTVDDNTISSGDNEIAPIKMVLGSATDVQTKKIPFAIKTFVDKTDYSGILYNISDLTIESTAVDGIVFNKSTAEGDMYISFTIDKNNVKKITDADVKVTFTDKSSGTARKIEILFTITVESDIYGIDLGSYSFVTTGKTDSQTKNVTLAFNNPDLQPEQELINKVEVGVYARSGDAYNSYDAGDIKVSGSNGAFTLTVKNTVLTGLNKDAQIYYIGAKYGDKVFYAPITITTTSEELALETTDNDNLAVTGAEVNGSKAGDTSVNVKTTSDTFKLAAYVYNRGLGADTRSSTTVSYKLFTSSARIAADEMTGENVEAQIDGNGIITFVKPNASGSGTLYYRAYFTDGGRNELRYIDVDIEYTVTIASVSIEGIEGGIQSDKTITLYYISDTAYTQLDLASFIKVKTDPSLGGVSVPAGTTVTVTSGNAQYLAVNGKILYPTGYTATPIAFTVTANDGISTPITETYYVQIKAIGAPTLTPSATSINVVADTSVDVSANILSYAGLKYEYDVKGYDGDLFTVVTSGDKGAENINVKVNRDYAFDGTEYNYGKTYTFTVNVKYTADGMSAAVVGGDSFASVKSVSLSLDWTHYTPKFTVVSVNGGDETIVANAATESASVAYDTATEYYIVLDTTDINSTAWYESADWTYTAADGNNIVSVGAFDSNGKAKITVSNAFGTTALKVTASAYGNSVTVGKNVTFNYGDKTTASVSVSSNGTTYTPIALTDNAAEVKIDFGTSLGGGTATAAKTLRYEIDAKSVGTTVTTSDIKVMYSGDVTTDGVLTDNGDGTFYMIFTVENVTTFTVSSAITVGGRTYYKDMITLDLIATKPVVSAADMVDITFPDGTVMFGANVANNGFVGNYTVSYEIINGATVADIAANGLLTPKKNNTDDYRVVVAITVTITDGVFVGNEYTVEKAVTILGVPLPEVIVSNRATKTWTNNTTSVSTTDSINLAGEFTLSDVVVNGSTFGFGSDARYDYAVSAPIGFGTNDYVISGNTLTVKNSGNTRAGGRFTVKVTATLGTGINGGRTVEKTFYIDITPVAEIAPTAISAKKGSYDVKGGVSLNVGAADSQIKGSDAYTVSYTLVNPTATVSIGGANKRLDALVSINGSALVLKENIPASGVTVILKPTITMTSGAYAGKTFGCDNNVTVAINGFTATQKAVAWNDAADVNAYQTVNVDSLLPALANIVGTPIIEVRALTNAAYVLLSDDGTAHPVITIDKTINVQATSGAAEIVELEFIVSSDDVEYYGKGTLAVASITPQVTFTLNPAEVVENGRNYVDLTAGSSLGVAISESHGLDITDVIANYDDDNVITVVKSGANLVISAADMLNSASKDVTISYAVCGISGTYALTVNISPRGDSSLFTVTNETVSVVPQAWIQYNDLRNNTGSQSAYGFVSEWIASDSNAYNIPNYIYIATQDRSALWQTVRHVRIQGFDATGNQVGNIVNFTVEQSNMSYYNYYGYIYLTRDNVAGMSGKIVGAVRTLRITFAMRRTDVKFNITYYSRNSGGSSTTTSKTYDVRSSGNYANITLDKNAVDAEITGTTTTLHYHTQTYDNISTSLRPTRPGYSFDAWYFDKDCKTKATGSPLRYSHTLYAGWNKARTQVTFKHNDGTTTEKKIFETYSEPYELPATPDRNGYTFVGWYTAGVGGSEITTATIVPVNPQTTLYARWTANKYTVTFKSDDVEIDDFSAKKTVTYGEAYGALPVLAKTGYTFDGWYTTIGQKVYSTTIVAPWEDHNLHAKFTALKYKVTLDANGGTITGDDEVEVTFDSAYGTISSTASKTGYTFDGWYTSAIGGVKVTDSDVKVTTAADHTLYAQWTAETYEVILSVSHASASVGFINVTYGETFSALGDVTVTPNAGYSFVEWRYNGNVITADTKVAITANITLIAVVNANSYTVTFDHDGLDSLSKTKVVTFGETYGTLPTPTKTGYRFDGWYNTSNEAGQADNANKRESGSTVNTAEDHTLYPKFTARTYTVTFQNATTHPTSITVTYDGKYSNLDAVTVTQKEGFTFVGWNDVYGNTVTKDSDVTIAGDTVLTAVWEEKTYTVTLDYNRGLSDDTDTVTVKHGEIAYILYKTPARDGFTFDGWYTENEGTETAFAVETPIKGDVTVYAKWTEIPVEPEPTPEYTVTLDYDREDGDTKTVTVKEGDYAYILYKTPTWDGNHKFEYWYTLDGETETKFDPDTAITEDVTVYAKWTEAIVVPDPPELP